ncbi:hypothetical protein ACFX2I_006649 [Malus domestica]
MIISMLAVHPYSPITKQQGESTILSETTTFSTLSPRMSFIVLQKFSNDFFFSSFAFFSSSISSSSLKPSLVADTSFLPSYSFNCPTAYSSRGEDGYVDLKTDIDQNGYADLKK